MSLLKMSLPSLGDDEETSVSDLDRTSLPIRRKAVRRRRQPDPRRFAAGLEPHRAPHPARRRTERAGRPHRRRRLRQPEHVWRPDPHTQLHACGRTRRALQPIPRHRAVLPDPRRPVDRTQQSRGRVRFHRRVRRRFRGLFRDLAARLCAAASDPARQRLQHRGVRKVAPHPRWSTRSGRAVRPVAEQLGLRPLLRDPRWRLEPVGSVPDRESEDHRDRSRVLRRRAPVLLPRRHGRPHDRVVARRSRPGGAETVLRLLLDGLQPRTPPRRQGVGRQVQGKVRPRLGQAPRGDVRPPEGTRCHPRECGAHAPRRSVPGLGRRSRQAEAVLRAPDGGVRRLLRER